MVYAFRDIFIIAIAGISAFFFYFFGAPFVLQIPENFMYRTNLVSLDNFYDQSSGGFLGEDRSVTSFSYVVDKTSNGNHIVHNNFDVRTLGGVKIIEVKKKYNINPKKWSHTEKYKEEDVYLFAPRMLKQGDSFTYQHVNYNTPLTMEYLRNEVVQGLPVRVYSADFKVDQTDNLTHLEGVPEKYGVDLDVSLMLWIEPVSGWLVQYSDSAIAYYYDNVTGERTHPWNKFRNTYSYASTIEQVNTAEQEKRKILVVMFIIPLGILCLGMLLFFVIKKRYDMIALLLFLFVGGSTIYVFGFHSRTELREPVRIGISRWVSKGNTAYDANIQGFKDAFVNAGYIEGVTVLYEEESAEADDVRQRKIGRNFIENDVDLIYSLTTSGTLILKEEVPHKPIVFSIVTYPVEAGIIDSIERSGNNLVGTRNWVSSDEQLRAFVNVIGDFKQLGFVHRKGELNSTIQFEEMRQAAERFNVELVHLGTPSKEDLSKILENNKERIDALYSACDSLVQGEAEASIATFVKKEGMPSFSCNSSGPFNEDVLATVVDVYTLGRLAGEQAVLILEGATPSSLSTLSTSRSVIYFNKRRALELGIPITQDILSKVDHIIE